MLFAGLRRRRSAPHSRRGADAVRGGVVQIQERARVGWRKLEEQIIAVAMLSRRISPPITAYS